MSEDISETTENYLKEIYLLIEKHDYARVSDIASNMHRSLSTVSGAIKRMADEGLLNYERYGKITLTDTGRNYAENVVSNYHLLAEFLQLIGVNAKQSTIDACEMEHISEESIEKLERFMDFINKSTEVRELMSKSGIH